MTLSLAGTRRDTGVSIAQVNLKLIWDVVSKIKVGQRGRAYVVDADGRLIAHPDISLVLRNTDMSKLAQVRSARSAGSGQAVQEFEDITGNRVLTAYAQVTRSAGWFLSRRRSPKPMRRFTRRSSAPAMCCSARFCSPSSPACSWQGGWWCRSRRCARARRGSARAISASASASGPATKSRRWPTSSTTWRASSRNPMPTSSKELKTAPTS